MIKNPLTVIAGLAVIVAIMTCFVVIKGVYQRQQDLEFQSKLVNENTYWLSNVVSFLERFRIKLDKLDTKPGQCSATTINIKQPSCLKWDNRGCYCIPDCIGTGLYIKGTRVCYNNTQQVQSC